MKNVLSLLVGVSLAVGGTVVFAQVVEEPTQPEAVKPAEILFVDKVAQSEAVRSSIEVQRIMASSSMEAIQALVFASEDARSRAVLRALEDINNTLRRIEKKI